MKWMHDRGTPPYEGIIWEDRDDLSFLNDPKFGVETLGDVQQESESVRTTQVSLSTVQVPASPDGMDAAWAERAEELNPTTTPPAPDDIDSIVNAPQAEGLAFDERALYGKLGEMARETGLPLGWTYPGFSPLRPPLRSRTTAATSAPTFTAVVAPLGMAKTVVADTIEKTIFMPEGVKTYTTPASDRGLTRWSATMATRCFWLKTRCVPYFGKCQVPNSTLAQTFCKLWSKDNAGVADKKGADSCDGKLCILGNIACEDAADFSKIVGSSTVTGFYDRLLLGYDTTPVKYRPLNIKPSFFTDEMVVRVPTWVWDAKDAGSARISHAAFGRTRPTCGARDRSPERRQGDHT